jgi:hypothetical protein
MKSAALLLLATMPALAQTSSHAAKADRTAVGVQGCKLVGNVKGTKLWAGDCVDATALRGSDPTPSPSLSERAGATIPPGQTR